MRQARSSGQSIEMRSACELLSVLVIENSRSNNIVLLLRADGQSYQTHCWQVLTCPENQPLCAVAHHYVGRDLEDLLRHTREPAKASSPYGTSCREATRLDENPMRAIIIVAGAGFSGLMML